MHTIQYHKKNNIDERKKCHTRSIRRLMRNSRENYPFALTQSFPLWISTRIGGNRSSWFVIRDSLFVIHTWFMSTPSIVSRIIRVNISLSSTGTSKTSSSCTWSIIAHRRLFSRIFASRAIIAYLSISAAVHWIGILIASRSAIERMVLLASATHGTNLFLPKYVSTYPTSRASLSISS